MRAQYVRPIADLLIGIFILGLSGVVSRLALDASAGGFGAVSWPINVPIWANEVPLSSGVNALIQSGNLIVENVPVARVIELLSSAASLGLAIYALWSLRQLLKRFTAGELFSTANTAALRKIGLALLGVCAISIVSTTIIQSMLVSAVEMPEGFVLHPSISWNVKGAENIWLEYEPPVITFFLGCLSLLCAHAFKAGMDFQQDSESVV